MELTLTDADGLVVASWKIERDLDLPDLEELSQCFYDAKGVDPLAVLKAEKDKAVVCGVRIRFPD
jgi:hypothetical protein